MAKQYPVKSVRVTSLFGESRGDHFHSGIDFAGVQTVYPADDGTVLFTRDTDRDPNLPAWGIGNVVVVEHTENFRTYYYHLEAGSIPRELSTVKTSDVLATMGDTGHSSGAHLHFVVEDFKSSVLVNPLKHLPVIEDWIRPQISAFLAMFKDRPNPTKLRDGSIIYGQSEFRLFAIAWDLKLGLDARHSPNAATGAGLKRLSLRVDDHLVRTYDFSVLFKKERGLVVEPDFTHDDVYGLPFNYRLGSFIPTQPIHAFEIVAEDWAGNLSVERLRVFFRY